jgi:hypothetical protein
MRVNCLRNPFAILRHLVVPEPKDFPPLALKIGVTNSVANAFRVLRAVGFDDQLSANVEKVDDVRTDRNLPAKLETAEATVAREAPKAKFSVGRRAANRSSARTLLRRDARVGLHRSSIGRAALIRRAFGAPPSPRGRRGSRTDVRTALSHRGKSGMQRAPSPPGRGWRAEGATDEGAWLMPL